MASAVMKREPTPEVGEEIARIEEMIRREPFRQNRGSISPARAVRPKLAASILLIDQQGEDIRLIMGKRNRNLTFMPGALVFPGGRVDRYDHRLLPAKALEPAVVEQIASGLPGKKRETRARALGVAAIRELAEETGIVLGIPSNERVDHPDWSEFANHGLRPSLARLKPIARAITPPYLPRRFDTWFFARRLEDAERDRIGTLRSSGELEALSWLRPEEALAGETREITRVILVELINRLRDDPHFEANPPISCYVTRRGRFRRQFLSPVT